MALAPALLVFAAATVQAPAASGVEALSALAQDGPDSVLVARVRARPDDVREALRRLLASAAGAAPDTGQAASLSVAERLAWAYAVAWRDSFQLRQVARYRAWSLAERQEKVAADSLRRAGNATLGVSGVDAALRLWRESVRRSFSLGDTAGEAAGLGNIGSGFYQRAELDSAEWYFTRSRALAEHVGDARTTGNAIGNLASVAKDRGDFQRAQELYRRAGAVRERSGDTRGAAADRNNLGLIARALGDLDGAKREFAEALAANRRDDRPELAALNLVNLGNVASIEGDYEQAEARYREALDIYGVRGNRFGAASVSQSLGRLALRRGDYGEALARLEEALRIYRQTGPVVAEVAVRRDIADTRAAMGNLQGALTDLGRAERLAVAGGVQPALRAQLALARADLAVQFNTLDEAERQYARAERLYRSTDDRAGLAQTQQGRGYLLLARQDYPGALATLQLALRTQRALGDTRSAALTQLLLGSAQQERGDTAAARRTLMMALDSLRAAGDVVGEAAALGAMGSLEAAAGATLSAESLYQRGLARIGDRAAPSVAWQLHAQWGIALRSRGALDRAAAELRAAVREAEQVAGRLTLEERRSAYLADKWEVYAQLASVEWTRGRGDSAFTTSERLRARQMLDLLARGRVAGSPDGEEGHDSLARREEDLRRRITELTRRLEAPQPTSELRGPALTAPATGAVREALANAQRAYSDLLLTMKEAKPEYASLVSGTVAPWGEIAARLAPDEALLEYLVSDSTTLVFVVTPDTLAVLNLDVGRHTLATLVDFTRGVLTHPAQPAGVASVPWRGPLRRLYRHLIEPVEAAGLLTHTHGLLIVPHAELHYLPFAALLEPEAAGRFLIERYRVTFAPSASVWLQLRERPARMAPLGVFALAPRVDALPASREEVGAITRLYGERARVLLGSAATKRALRAGLTDAGIVHLATFGVLNKDNPLFSFVELAPGDTADGRLEVHDVFGLDLRAGLVVLSACRTAVGSGALTDVPPGDDWVGLVRAFLFAGARNVVATLWPVEDRATAALMKRFYTELAAGRTESEALATAQRAALRNLGTADPFYWAGFTINGGQ